MTFNAYMHERNIYKNQLDFAQIILDFPEFKKYVIPDAKGKKNRVDFTDTRAIRMLTKILLKKDFNLNVNIPEGFLIPTVPQRLNYILWLEDLISNVSKKELISGIDIGTGPCAIFSILGARKNGWKFVATESSEEAISWALKNVDENNLKDSIKVFKVSQGSALREVLSSNNEHYDFCLCNPPFFDNIEEIRKKHKNSKETIADVAQKEEIFVKGGELDFVKNILRDSLVYKNRISLFTSMFGKKRSFLEIVKEVKEIKDAKYTTTEFCQGNTVRWGIAWTFDESINLKKEVKKKVKPQKDKPPLEYQIPFKKPNLHVLLKQATDFLKTLQIPVTQTKVSTNFAELLLKSNKNMWTHQRRKRRELERQKKEGCNSETKIVDEVALNSKDDKAQENIFLTPSPKSEAVVNDYSMDNKTVVSENNELNPSDLLNVKDCSSDIKNTMLPHQSTFSSNTDSPQNRKRKSLFSSEDLSKRKKELNIDEEITETNTNQSDNGIFQAIKSENNATSDDKYTTKDLPTKQESVKSPSSEDNGSSEISTNKTDCNTMNTCENSSAAMEIERSGKNENIDADQDLILNCHLHFIKGKNKFYVKMNCPPTADRSTMYQVFQLLKNKIK